MYMTERAQRSFKRSHFLSRSYRTASKRYASHLIICSWPLNQMLGFDCADVRTLGELSGFQTHKLHFHWPFFTRMCAYCTRELVFTSFSGFYLYRGFRTISILTRPTTLPSSPKPVTWTGNRNFFKLWIIKLCLRSIPSTLPSLRSRVMQLSLGRSRIPVSPKSAIFIS